MISRRFGAFCTKIAMSTLLLSILGLSIAAQQCSVWKEIAPCTCTEYISRINVSCEKMSSFGEIVRILQNRFLPSEKIVLKISSSILEDLHQRSFKELNMTIENIQLNNNNLSQFSASSFLGLPNVNFLSLSDNNFDSVPDNILEVLPSVKTLDVGRTGIRSLKERNFKSIPYVQHIMLGGNLISQMETNSIPIHIRHLHLGRNRIKDLNNTLINLTNLNWIFINVNELTTLENQLPTTAPHLMILHAAHNKIKKLPQHLKTFSTLHSLFINNNLLTTLDGVLSKLRKLERASFENNRISVLTKEDFLETESLQCLCMANNYITSLNNSLPPLRSLSVLNLTHNLLTEFSLQEIKGLPNLKTTDISYNRIHTLLGPTANLVEWETNLTELKLNNNDLRILNGALSGLNRLRKLNLSFNKLTQISPDDLIGLDQLRVLDISHNELTTLEETGKSFLPVLNELLASYNRLTILNHDFHGLPILCWADLSNNKIVALGRDLVSKTRCKMHDTWGTLKVLLQNNPILCDAALPEIIAEMEANHTRISGVSHCSPLSEQPTTSKPNGFLGFISEEDINMYQPYGLNNDFEINSIYKQAAYQPIPYSVEQQTKTVEPLLNTVKFLPIENNKDALINQDHLQTSRPNYDRLGKLINLQQSENSNLHHDKINMNQLEPILPINANQQNQVPDHQLDQLNAYPLNVFEIQQPNEQPLINKQLLTQQEQLNMMATEIEQLRLQVQELTAQNKLLNSNNKNNKLGDDDNRHDIIKPIVPEEVIIHTITNEEMPDKVEKVMTS